MGQVGDGGAAPAHHGSRGLQVHPLPREIRSHADLHHRCAHRGQVPAEFLYHPLGPEGSRLRKTLLLHHRHQGGSLKGFLNLSESNRLLLYLPNDI